LAIIVCNIKKNRDPAAAGSRKERTPETTSSILLGKLLIPALLRLRLRPVFCLGPNLRLGLLAHLTLRLRPGLRPRLGPHLPLGLLSRLPNLPLRLRPRLLLDLTLRLRPGLLAHLRSWLWPWLLPDLRLRLRAWLLPHLGPRLRRGLLPHLPRRLGLMLPIVGPASTHPWLAAPEALRPLRSRLLGRLKFSWLPLRLRLRLCLLLRLRLWRRD